MSYHIYTTDGIVLKRTAFGEANIFTQILTRDLGLITVSAQAVRLSSSKLRSALQEYSLISLSCIKGKNGWKATSAREVASFFYNYPEYSHRVISQIVFLILKMIQGEIPHPEIFETVKSGFEFLKNLPEKEIQNFETLIVLRILHQLGYVVIDSDTEIFLKNMNEWGVELLGKVEENKKTIVGLINKALKESQL